MAQDCYGIVPETPADPVCPGQYRCPTSDNPKACAGMQYVFAPHYFRKGFVQPGASGGYVPAITVCQTGLSPVSVGRVRQNPGAIYGGPY